MFHPFKDFKWNFYTLSFNELRAVLAAAALGGEVRKGMSFEPELRSLLDRWKGAKDQDKSRLIMKIRKLTNRMADAFFSGIKEAETLAKAEDRSTFFIEQGMKKALEETLQTVKRLTTSKTPDKGLGEAHREELLKGFEEHWKMLHEKFEEKVREIWKISKAQYQHWQFLEIRERLDSQEDEAVLSRIRRSVRAFSAEKGDEKARRKGIRQAKNIDELKEAVHRLMEDYIREIHSTAMMAEETKIMLFRIKARLKSLEELEHHGLASKRHLQHIHKSICRILLHIESQDRLLFHEVQAAA